MMCAQSRTLIEQSNLFIFFRHERTGLIHDAGAVLNSRHVHKNGHFRSARPRFWTRMPAGRQPGFSVRCRAAAAWRTARHARCRAGWPPSSRSGMRVTTKCSPPKGIRSSRLGWPLSTTSRSRLAGSTSSMSRPRTPSGSSMPSLLAYLALIHTMRAWRLTATVPSHWASRWSNSKGIATLRKCSGEMPTLRPFSSRSAAGSPSDRLAREKSALTPPPHLQHSAGAAAQRPSRSSRATADSSRKYQAAYA